MSGNLLCPLHVEHKMRTEWVMNCPWLQQVSSLGDNCFKKLELGHSLGLQNQGSLQGPLQHLSDPLK